MLGFGVEVRIRFVCGLGSRGFNFIIKLGL